MTVIDVATLHEQAERTMARADAHSEQVKGIMLALLGGMVWRGEPGSVEFKNHDGGLANVLSIKIVRHDYTFVCNANSGQIDVRDRARRGRVVRSFSNQSRIPDLRVRTAARS